jgi:polyhydroxybutyrate depolymerase
MRLALLVLLTACGSSSATTPAIDAKASDALPPGADAPRDGALATCVGRAAQPLDATRHLTVGGRDRTYDVHVPASYDPTRATPLVLDIHGLTMTGAWQATLSGMSAAADRAGFVAVYPDGTGVPRGFNAGDCCLPASSSGVDDVAFMAAILDDLEATLCVDAARVYATGFSNGAFLSHRLGCELADRIAAIAPVSGVMGIASCTPSRPVPVLEFHGAADLIEPYAGGGIGNLRSVATTIHDWAARNGCTGPTTTTFQHGDVTCQTHGGCTAGADVTLCTVSDGGHQWPGGQAYPGGGLLTQDISATDAIWTFFAAHPRP